LTDSEVFASLLSVSAIHRNGPTVWRRFFISAGIGIASGLLCRALMLHLGLGAADFNYALRGAHNLLSGKDPYSASFQNYPLPAVIVGMPFLTVKPEVAGGLFFGISSGLLALGLLREGYTRLLVFLAYPYWAAMITVQWAPLLMASALLPWLLPVTLTKPPLGAPIFLTYPTRRGVIGSVIFLGLTFLIMPNWPLRWLSSVGNYPYYVPLFVPAGWSLILAAWRKRDPDSHLLLLSCATPQHWFYDTFILWLIPKTRQEILATVVLSWGAGITRWYFMPGSWTEVGTWAVLWIYLPMLGVILIRQDARKEMTAQLPAPRATKAAMMHE
jgi:hypothetical protein